MGAGDSVVRSVGVGASTPTPEGTGPQRHPCTSFPRAELEGICLLACRWPMTGAKMDGSLKAFLQDHGEPLGTNSAPAGWSNLILLCTHRPTVKYRNTPARPTRGGQERARNVGCILAPRASLSSKCESEPPPADPVPPGAREQGLQSPWYVTRTLVPSSSVLL